MYLKTDKIVVTVGGITINSHAVLNGKFYFDPSVMTGWKDTVDIRRTTVPRPISDGDFKENSRKGSRSISISGYTVANSVSELHALRDQLAGVLADGSFGTMTVQDGAGTRTATVSINSRTSWIQQTDTYAVWKLELYAPDPRIYGAEKTITLTDTASVGGMIYTSNPVTPFTEPYYLNYPLDFSTDVKMQSQFLTNAGNVDAWPTFKVTGDFFSGFSIIDNLGHTITYSGAVSSLSPVSIDSRTGSATQDGNDRSTFLSKRQWFPIPPNKAVQPSFKPVQSVNGWCDILYRDTWI